MSDKEWYTITEASAELGTQSQYVRALIKKGPKGPFPGAKKVSIGENLVRWEIPAKELIARKNSASTRGRGRADGRTKYFIYANESELTKINKVLEPLHIEIKPAYDPVKGKKNYARQKAKKAAARAAAKLAAQKSDGQGKDVRAAAKAAKPA